MHAVDELSMPVDSITMTCHHPEHTGLSLRASCWQNGERGDYQKTQIFNGSPAFKVLQKIGDKNHFVPGLSQKMVAAQ